MRRLLIWSGVDAWRAEAAIVDLSAGGLSASGTQFGAEPMLYRLDYELEVGPDWIKDVVVLAVSEVVVVLHCGDLGHLAGACELSQVNVGDADVRDPPPVALAHDQLEAVLDPDVVVYPMQVVQVDAVDA
jgi:hypothetical protein